MRTKIFLKNFSKTGQKVAKTEGCWTNKGERGRKDLPPGKKGGETMTPDRHKEDKQHAFDTFCKKVLRYELRSHERDMRRLRKRQVSLSELPEEAMEQLAVYDTYSWDYTPIAVCGSVILIENDRLAEALLSMSKEDREIILMYWFLDMADSEIAEEISMSRRTVNRHRTKSYQMLKELMGGEADE